MIGFLQDRSGGRVWYACTFGTAWPNEEPVLDGWKREDTTRSFEGTEEELREAMSPDGEVSRFEIARRHQKPPCICLMVVGATSYSHPCLANPPVPVGQLRLAKRRAILTYAGSGAFVVACLLIFLG
jgi:hypothetical protein